MRHKSLLPAYSAPDDLFFSETSFPPESISNLTNSFSKTKDSAANTEDTDIATPQNITNKRFIRYY